MFWQEDAPFPLANGALCLSTPKHNGKSGPVTYTMSLTNFHPMQLHRLSQR